MLRDLFLRLTEKSLIWQIVCNCSSKDWPRPADLTFLEAWAQLFCIISVCFFSLHNRVNLHTAACKQLDEAECCRASGCSGNNTSKTNWVMKRGLLFSCRTLVRSVNWECAKSGEVPPPASQAPIQQSHRSECMLHCRYSVEWGEKRGVRSGERSLREAEGVFGCVGVWRVCVRRTMWKCVGHGDGSVRDKDGGRVKR